MAEGEKAAGLNARSMSETNKLTQRYFLLFFLFVALWFLHHPYRGILHDSILYTAQALRYLHPDNFARDIFFLYGSQDDYTLFSPFYASLIRIFGQGDGAMLVTLFGALLWCYAVWRLSRQWSGAHRWLALFLLAIMPIRFGGNEIFAAAEPFAVPRLWADAFTILACAFWLERRYYWATALWVPAILMHPLMALAGGIFVFFYELRFRLRWGIAVLAGATLASALALSGFSLFGRLFQVMDPTWFDLVYQRTSLYMFPTAWTIKEHNTLVFHAVALLWAARLSEDAKFRRVLWAACATGLAGWLVAVIGGDWLHSVLVLQVQPWRTIWLTYVFGWVAVAWLVLRLWQSARFAVLGIAAAWLLREYSGGLILMLALFLYAQRANLSQAARRWAVAGFGAAILFHVFWRVWDASMSHLALSPEDEWDLAQTAIDWRNVLNHESDALLTLLGGLLAYWIWRANSRPALALLFVLIVFLGSGQSWDTRRQELKTLESSDSWEMTPFNKHIPRNTTVYWLDGLQPTWLLLGRSSYYSQQQAAGLNFSQPQAMELYRRYLRVRQLGGRAADFRLFTHRQAFMHRFDKNIVIDRASLPALRFACGDPELDFVILPERHEPWAIASWYTPEFRMGLDQGLYLYACEDLRKS